MSVKIFENYIVLDPNWDASKLLLAKTANEDLKQIVESLKNSRYLQLDPNDGRELIIHITADIDKGLIIKKEYSF